MNRSSRPVHIQRAEGGASSAQDAEALWAQVMAELAGELHGDRTAKVWRVISAEP